MRRGGCGPHRAAGRRRGRPRWSSRRPGSTATPATSALQHVRGRGHISSASMSPLPLKHRRRPQPRLPAPPSPSATRARPARATARRRALRGLDSCVPPLPLLARSRRADHRPLESRRLALLSSAPQSCLITARLAGERRGKDLEVVNAEGYVLCEVLVEDPHLAVGCWARDTMSVVMEQDTLILCATPQRVAQLLHILDRRIQTLFVSRPRLCSKANRR